MCAAWGRRTRSGGRVSSQNQLRYQLHTCSQFYSDWRATSPGHDQKKSFTQRAKVIWLRGKIAKNEFFWICHTGGTDARLISDWGFDRGHPLHWFRTGKRPRPRRVVRPHEYRRKPCSGELRVQLDRGLSPLGDRRQSWFLQPEPCVQETIVVRALEQCSRLLASRILRQRTLRSWQIHVPSHRVNSQ